MLPDHEPERIARLAQDLLGDRGCSGQTEGERRAQPVEDALGLGFARPPCERAGQERQVDLARVTLGVRVDLPDPDHGIVGADQLALAVSFEHAHLSFVGGPDAVVRAGQHDEEPGVRHHKTGLPLLPRVPDQGRAQDVHPQERQQDRKAGCAVDILPHGRGPVPRVEECRVGQRRGQGPQRDHRQFQRREKPIDRINPIDESVHQGRLRRTRRTLRWRSRCRRKLLGGRRHIVRTCPEVRVSREGPGAGRFDPRRVESVISTILVVR